MNELELRLQGQEKEMKGQANKFQELQLQLEKTKVELIEKEKLLNKTRDELVRTTAQYDQAATKVLDFPWMIEKVLSFIPKVTVCEGLWKRILHAGWCRRASKLSVVG